MVSPSSDISYPLASAGISWPDSSVSSIRQIHVSNHG